MPPQLIGPIPDSRPSGFFTSQASRRALPADVLKDASIRLGVLSLVVGALWILGTVFGHVANKAMLPAGDARWLRLNVYDAIAGISVAISIALFVYTRRTTRDPQSVLDLGLVYVVLMAFALGVMFHWQGDPEHWHLEPQISWIGVTILIAAAFLPTSMPKMVLAGTIAVAMNPVGMWIANLRGGFGFGPWWHALLMHYPDFLLVGVAVVISGVVTRLGRQVSKAREMGSYQLAELLGKGGMGEVYKATHQLLARPAAIKLIRPQALGGKDDEAARLAVRRFHREAEAAANLRSPHTVEIYDFGVTEDDTLYFVMEMLDGMDLEALVKAHGPLPAARVVHILCQVCDSLEEAHRAGLVHRDIKPANIHVGRLGLHRDFVKVLDFGLVKPVTAEQAGHSLATVAGQTPGTPAYMAPEMALSEAVDGRADIYALGCVAYYLLTAKLVFEAETAMAMIAKHLQNAPLAPSLRTDNHVPRALDRLVIRCLAKNREDRPQSASEIARALKAVDVLAWGEDEAHRWWDALANAGTPPHIARND